MIVIWFVLATFAALAALDRLLPARRFPRVRGWRWKGVAFLVLTLGVSSTVPLVWDEWFAEHRLIDATGLGHVGGAIVGFLAFQLVLYGWHRALHRVPFLWRWLHQMHHSAERVDVFGAFYFHPLDVAAFALVGSVSLVLLLGITAPAAVAATLFANSCSMFQHANLRTPRWLGYLIQRPESHSIHHERGVHAFNYGDIPLWDMVFGTFRNPATFEGAAGFYDGASRRVVPMLLGRDVSTPPAPAEPALAGAAGRPAA